MASLSIRLMLFVLLLVATAMVLVGYYFDLRREQAIARDTTTELRHDAERLADRLVTIIGRAADDAVVLAQTPLLAEHLAAVAAAGPGVATTLGPGARADLERFFLALGSVRPHYFQIRLLAITDDARELVRVERAADGALRPVPGVLQQKGRRYYVQQALAAPAGAVYYSPIDLNYEHQRLSTPLQPTLRVLARVTDSAGQVLGLIAINVDMRAVFEQLQAGLAVGESLYVVDPSDEFLWHPDPQRTFGSARGQPYGLTDEFSPTFLAALPTPTLAAGPGPGLRVDQGRTGYRIGLALDPSGGNGRTSIILTRSLAPLQQSLRRWRQEALGWLLLGLIAAGALTIGVLRRLTASLTRVVSAADQLAAGELDSELPATGPIEVRRLALAFNRMTREIAHRETALRGLTERLDHKVAERTAALEELQRSLREQQALQQTILQNIGDGVVVADLKGQFLLWNGVATALIGIGPAAVGPEEWAAHYGLYRSEKLDRLAVDELPLAQAMRGAAVTDREIYIQNRAVPRGRWISVTARPLRNAQGHIEGGVAILLDVTDKKLLDRQRAAHRAQIERAGRFTLLTQLTDTVAHQISQPLAAIANYAGAALQLSRSGRLDPAKLTELLGNIVRLAERGGATTRELKELAQFDRPAHEPVMLAEFIANCADFIAAECHRLDIQMRVNLPGPNLAVTGDRIHLEQALIHVLTNALQALTDSPDGQKRLTISASAPSDQWVEIRVEDNGPGIAPAIADRLFEPWVTTRKNALGVGLAIASTIIDHHGGTITCDREGETTVFRIVLPQRHA